LTKKANLRASNALPSKYLPEVQAKYSKALSSQFVPTNPALWEVEHYAEFLTERRKLIAQGINAFLDGLLAEDQQLQPVDEQIKALIASGESEVVEFKSSLRWDYKTSSKNKILESVIVKTVAGFMNGKGGTLLVGIGPKGEILGIENDYATLQKDPTRDGFEQKLTHLLASNLGKEFVPLTSVSFVAVENKDICWLRVDPSPKPVYVEEDNDIKFYARLGNTTQPMNPKEMTQYMSMRWETQL
jgi:schlafen family protein